MSACYDVSVLFGLGRNETHAQVLCHSSFCGGLVSGVLPIHRSPDHQSAGWHSTPIHRAAALAHEDSTTNIPTFDFQGDRVNLREMHAPTSTSSIASAHSQI